MRFRNLSIAAVILSFLAGSTLGQDLLDKVSLAYSIQPRPQVTAINNYSSPLIGMVITVASTVSPYRTTEIIWFDSGVNFKHDPPLLNNQSRSYGVGPADQAPSLQPQLMAIECEDGTSAGDPQWLSKLHIRRKAAYDEIGTVAALLNRALSQHQAKKQIISDLNNMEASLRTNVPEVAARGVADLVIYAAVSNLERGGIRGDVGNPEKTIPLTILPLFDQWRAALKRYEKGIN